MTQELRTLYVDSHWCKKEGGGLSLNLTESMEVPAQDLVAYVDDFTIAGQFTAVNSSTNRMYVVEETPTGLSYNDPYVLFKKDADDPGTVLEVELMSSFGTIDAQYAQFEYFIELPFTQSSNNVGCAMLYRSDDGCQLAGNVFHGIVDPTSSATPPADDAVEMDFKYSTGIGSWTAMFPYQTAEWGWREFSNIAFSDTKKTLRILELPVLDYSASTLRPVLENMLNEHAFKGYRS